MKEYFKRLKEHPGLGVATMVTILGFLAGSTNKSLPPDKWYIGGVLGLLFIGIPAWLMVLISNRKK